MNGATGPEETTALLTASIPRVSRGHAKPNVAATTSPATPATMGTKRRPPKKAR